MSHPSDKATVNKPCSAKAVIAAFKECYRKQAQAGGKHPSDNGTSGGDDGSELLGQAVERHPITTARAHRG